MIVQAAAEAGLAEVVTTEAAAVVALVNVVAEVVVEVAEVVVEVAGVAVLLVANLEAVVADAKPFFTQTSVITLTDDINSHYRRIYNNRTTSCTRNTKAVALQTMRVASVYTIWQICCISCCDAEGCDSIARSYTCTLIICRPWQLKILPIASS